MGKRVLGKDRYGIQKVMHVRDYFADSLGQFGLNAISGIVGQLTFFYTDKVGMAAGAVATMMLICKIIDAFTDLIMGTIVDHTKPGKEKYRPWLLKAGIPAGIVLAAVFCIPKGGNGLQLAYLLITNFLLTAVFFTAIAIPYCSLQVVRTNSQEERAVMGTWRAAGGYVSGAVVAITLVPVTNMLGGTQSAWIKYGVALGLIIALGFIICYIFSKETAIDSKNEEKTDSKKEEENTTEEVLPFRETIKKLFHNKYWVIILVLNFLANIIYGLTGGSGVYYCKWIFGDENLVGILGGITIIPTILGFGLVAPMVKKWGPVNTLKISFALGIIAGVLRTINPYNYIFNVVLWQVYTFATIPMMCLLGVMISMSIDYNEYLYGNRMVASAHSASGFGCKVGSGIGGSLIGWCLAIANYDATLTVATTATKYAVLSFSIYIPLVMFIVMYILISKFDLAEKLPVLQEEMKKRKSAKRGDLV